ncbi:MAG: hypothetical protein II877_12600 [Synergistaceae bacterium]|nr:hypothetical protein [Synergistaceae bacterium]MBQ6971683.1 hypothetical protein [Synergistaceae bacterium]
MTSVRSEELTGNPRKFRRHWLNFCVRYGNTASGDNLSIRTNITDCDRPSLLVHHE